MRAKSPVAEASGRLVAIRRYHPGTDLTHLEHEVAVRKLDRYTGDLLEGLSKVTPDLCERLVAVVQERFDRVAS